MFIPNTTATLSRLLELNIYSEPVFGDAILVECGVVKLSMDAQKTSVRADSSASRGTAEERVIDAKILFLPDRSPAIGDRVTINGMVLRCNAVHPRLDVTGRLDHHECEFERWFRED